MSIMVMSDIHYEKDFHGRVWEGDALKWMLQMVDFHRPSDLVLCGDTGYAWDEEEWENLLQVVKVHAIFGNHDNVQMMKGLRNLDRSKVWARDGETRMIQSWKFGFINGIMGDVKERRRRMNYKETYKGHTTDITWVPRLLPEEYLAAANTLAQKGPIDVLCTHASIPMSDETRFHPTEEFQVLTDVVGIVRPRIWFSGHLSGPFKVGEVHGATRFVRVDSSPQDQHYALLGNKILIYHDRDLVEQVDYP